MPLIPRTRRQWLGVAVRLGILYLVAVLMIMWLQRSLIYHPYRAEMGQLNELAVSLGMEAWRDSDGSLLGWKLPVHHGKPTAHVLIFHGNAGYALHRAHLANSFRLTPGWEQAEISILEYPGFGAQPGKPREDAIMALANRAATILSKDGLPLYLVGESLGAAVATGTAASHPENLSGLLLLTPFTSLADAGAHHFPFLPVRLILREYYHSVDNLKKVHVPVAVAVAGEDEVVPSGQGVCLYESYSGPKKLWVIPGATHNTMPYSPTTEWWPEALSFLKSGNQ